MKECKKAHFQIRSGLKGYFLFESAHQFGDYLLYWSNSLRAIALSLRKGNELELDEDQKKVLWLEVESLLRELEKAMDGFLHLINRENRRLI